MTEVQAQSCPIHPTVQIILRKSGGRLLKRCPVCHADYMAKQRTSVHLQAVSALGGKCMSCGFKTYPQLLELHHPEMDPTVAEKRKGWERFKHEIKHLTLLCPTCHGVEHLKLRGIDPYRVEDTGVGEGETYLTAVPGSEPILPTHPDYDGNMGAPEEIIDVPVPVFAPVKAPSLQELLAKMKVYDPNAPSDGSVDDAGDDPDE